MLLKIIICLIIFSAGACLGVGLMACLQAGAAEDRRMERE